MPAFGKIHENMETVKPRSQGINETVEVGYYRYYHTIMKRSEMTYF